MIEAYILIQTHVGEAGQIAQELRGLDGVVHAEPVTGPYDIIARAEAGDLDHLGRLVAEGIQAIKGITRTLTCVIPASRR